MNEEYWKKEYKNSSKLSPSPFARFCIDRITSKDIVIDLGAGTLRDTDFLANTADMVIAVEPNNEDVTIKSLKEIDIDNVDIVYARWLFHAIDEVEEDYILDWCRRKEVKLMAEFRVVGDNPDNTHERRLIDPEEFIEKLLFKGFELEYYEKSRGLSKIGNNDPLLSRIIAQS